MKGVEDLFNFVLQLIAHCDLKEYPPKQGVSKQKLKGGKGGGKGGPPPKGTRTRTCAHSFCS